jgi:hypothetical protein
LQKLSLLWPSWPLINKGFNQSLQLQFEPKPQPIPTQP